VRGGTSSSQKALFFNLRRLRARLAQTTDQRPRPVIHAEIAKAIGVSANDVALMDSRLSGPDIPERADPRDRSGAADRQDFLVDKVPLPDETVTELIDGERRLTWLRSALAVLNERELMIVKERRLQEDGATLESLGESLGISKERVRQIENRALEKLREALLPPR
jgi:RNA polymerase sigma-32 factor